MSLDKYTPRRASATRWLEGAPDYILDIFDTKGPGERYTVFFGKGYTYHLTPSGGASQEPGPFGKTYVQYLGMDSSPTHPQGVSMWGEMEADKARDYRYRQKHRRIRWVDLPEIIRRHIKARAK